MKRDARYLIRCAVILAVTAVILLLTYHCPIKLIFGIDCPTCGMTRAFIALLRLDIPSAFGYHELFPIILVLAVYLLLRTRINLGRRGKSAEKVMFGLIIALFILRWAVKLILLP